MTEKLTNEICPDTYLQVRMRKIFANCSISKCKIFIRCCYHYYADSKMKNNVKQMKIALVSRQILGKLGIIVYRLYIALQP